MFLDLERVIISIFTHLSWTLEEVSLFASNILCRVSIWRRRGLVAFGTLAANSSYLLSATAHLSRRSCVSHRKSRQLNSFTIRIFFFIFAGMENDLRKRCELFTWISFLKLSSLQPACSLVRVILTLWSLIVSFRMCSCFSNSDFSRLISLVVKQQLTNGYLGV